MLAQAMVRLIAWANERRHVLAFYHMQLVSLTCACAPGPPPFLRVILKTWEWPGDEAKKIPACWINSIEKHETMDTYTIM